VLSSRLKLCSEIDTIYIYIWYPHVCDPLRWRGEKNFNDSHNLLKSFCHINGKVAQNVLAFIFSGCQPCFFYVGDSGELVEIRTKVWPLDVRICAAIDF